MSEFISKKCFRTEKHPPEGGWGYLIGVGMALPFICALSSMPSFGLMFNDFLTGLGEKTSAVTLITSSFFSALSFAGLFTNTLFKKFSIRTVGLLGGTMYFLGSLMTIFVNSVEQLMVSFSFLQGAGFGFMIPVAYTTFNLYFITNRVAMMSAAQTLIGIGTMIYPILVQFLMETYGFRGSMAILAAINGHAIFGMLVMHPVEWHYKVVKIECDETESLMEQKDRSNEVKIVLITEKQDEYELIEGKMSDNENMLNVPKRNSLQMNNLNEINSIKSERSSSLDPTQMFDGFDPNQRRASSISSLGNWTGAVIVSEAVQPKRKRNGKWQKVVDFLDLGLLNDFIYVNIVLGISFALYSDTSFFTLQPMYLFELGFSKADTAIIIAAGAAADLGSRVVLAVLSMFIQVKARYVYLAGAVGTIAARFVFLTIYDFVNVAILTGVMGFFRTWLHVPLPLVFAEYLSQERFPSGYGLFMFLQGNITFVIGPFIGWIRDVTQSYVICFHSLSLIMALCAVPWLIEIAWLRLCHSNANKGNN